MLARLCIALVFGLGVSLANATTLSISGGSFATEATTNAPGIPQGTTGYSSTVPAGGSPASLLLDSFSTLKFEFLGSQALNDNRLFLMANGMQMFGNKVSAVGASAFVDMGLSDGGGGPGDADFKDMTIRISVAPVPETWMMMVAGLVIMGFVATRRARTH